MEALQNFFTYVQNNSDYITEATLQHLRIVLIVIAFATVTSVLLGVWIQTRPMARALVLSTASIFLTLPALALFALFIPIMGIGNPPAMLALWMYALLPILRNALPEMMRLFDTAEPSLIVGKRNETTVPTQALYLMNNPFVIGQAFNMAKRVMDSTEGKPDGIRLAYELAFAREATDDEVSRAHEFLNSVAEEKDRPGQWTVLCQALLASAEFRYID